MQLMAKNAVNGARLLSGDDRHLPGNPTSSEN